MTATRSLNTQAVLWLTLLTFVHGLWYTAIGLPWQSPDEDRHYELLRLTEQKRKLALTPDDRSPAMQWEIADSMLSFEHWRYRLRPTPPAVEDRTAEYPLGKDFFRPQAPLYYLFSFPIYWWTASWPVTHQLYALRILSVVFHCLTVVVTYLLACQLFGSRSWAPLASAFLLAIQPQYTYISASYNNDALPPLFVAASLYALSRGLDQSADWRWLAASLASGALALLAKRTAVGIVPVLGIGLIVYGVAWLRARRAALRYAGVAAVAVALVAAAFLAFVLWTGPTISRELAVTLRIRTKDFGLIAAYLREPQGMLALAWGGEWMLFFRSFWGYFGWIVERVPEQWYTFMGWVTAIWAVGGLVGVARWLARQDRPASRSSGLILALMGLGTLVTLLSIAAQHLVAPDLYGAQGRYAFPFIPAYAVLAMWGWLAWWPRRWHAAATLAAMACLVAFDIACWATVLSLFNA